MTSRIHVFGPLLLRYVKNNAPVRSFSDCISAQCCCKDSSTQEWQPARQHRVQSCVEPARKTQWLAAVRAEPKPWSGGSFPYPRRTTQTPPVCCIPQYTRSDTSAAALAIVHSTKCLGLKAATWQLRRQWTLQALLDLRPYPAHTRVTLSYRWDVYGTRQNETSQLRTIADFALCKPQCCQAKPLVDRSQESGRTTG